MCKSPHAHPHSSRLNLPKTMCSKIRRHEAVSWRERTQTKPLLSEPPVPLALPQSSPRWKKMAENKTTQKSWWCFIALRHKFRWFLQTFTTLTFSSTLAIEQHNWQRWKRWFNSTQLNLTVQHRFYMRAEIISNDLLLLRHFWGYGEGLVELSNFLNRNQNLIIKVNLNAVTGISKGN